MGFTLIYYLNGFTNVAFAENITFGAFFSVIFTSILGLDFYVSIVPAALLSGVVSVLTYLCVFRARPAPGRRPHRNDHPLGRARASRRATARASSSAASSTISTPSCRSTTRSPASA